MKILFCDDDRKAIDELVVAVSEYMNKKFIKNENLNKDEIVIVGDQILTDIICSKGLKIKSVLVTISVIGCST